MPKFQEFKRPRNSKGQFSSIPFELNDIKDSYDLTDEYNPAPEEDSEPSWEYYDPTKSINPSRPRTERSRYNAKEQSLEIMFRGGTASYVYDDVHPNTWRAFKNTESPGKFINKYLNAHPYSRGGYGGVE